MLTAVENPGWSDSARNFVQNLLQFINILEKRVLPIPYYDHHSRQS